MTVKGGEIAVYLQNFILGQLVVAANSPENIDDNVCAGNEIKLITPIYNTCARTFAGLKMKLPYIRSGCRWVFFQPWVQ